MTELKTKRDPLGTQRRILVAATEEFTRAGLSGARVDQIAKKAQTNERMLYYYFGSKEQLFTAVLEQAFASFCALERAISFNGLGPVEAITRLAHSIWQYYREHPEILRLVNNENLHEARYLKKSTRVPDSLSPIVDTIRAILKQGEEAKVFRPGVDAVLLMISICALGYYVVSNRHTIEVSIGRDYTHGVQADAAVQMHTAMLLSYLTQR
jgi:AcrR family transcriptional regulator